MGMSNIKFYDYKTVHKEIKELCERNANCTNGSKFYVLKVKRKNIYVVDNTLKNLSYSDILELYKTELERKKQVKEVLKNLPEIEICFDEWDLVDDINIGSYTNNCLEIEILNYLVTLDFKVEEKSKESGGFDSADPLEIDKLGNKIRIYDIKIVREDSTELELTERDYKKLIKAITKNIIL